MAGEGDVKTKVGLAKMITRSLQDQAFLNDTTQFDTHEFQELVQMARKLNGLMQQLLLSAQYILLRGKMSGITVHRLQEMIPEVEAWLREISVKEYGVHAAPDEDDEEDDVPARPRGVRKPTPEESAQNAGSFFTEPGSPHAGLDVQVADDAQRLDQPTEPAAPAEPPVPIYYYQDVTFEDGETVCFRFTEADHRLTSLVGVHIITEQDLGDFARAMRRDNGALSFETDPETVKVYRDALEETRDQLPPPDRAVTVDQRDLDAFATGSAGSNPEDDGDGEDREPASVVPIAAAAEGEGEKGTDSKSPKKAAGGRKGGAVKEKGKKGAAAGPTRVSVH